MLRIRIHLIRIRIQHFRLNTDPTIQSGSRVLMTTNWKKCTAKKIKFVRSKNTICLSLGLQKGRPSYKRRSLQPPKKTSSLQSMDFLIFFLLCELFLSSGIRIRIPNPDTDPLTWLNPDPIRIRIWITACCRTFSMEVGSMSGEVILFSTARMTPSSVWMPMAVEPSLIASMAYSTWHMDTVHFVYGLQDSWGHEQGLRIRIRNIFGSWIRIRI